MIQALSAGRTQQLETTVETLSVVTRTGTGLRYRKMELESLPTLVSELTALPAMSWKRFARDLHDGRIEQISSPEAEVLRQLVTEGADALSAKSKKERFDDQVWDHVPSTRSCESTRSRRKLGKCRNQSPCTARLRSVSRSPRAGAASSTLQQAKRWDGTGTDADTTKDVIIDTMALSTIFSALDLRDGFYEILMRESDIPLTAVSTSSGMLWKWLVMPQGLTHAPATCSRCVTQLLRSVSDFIPSYFNDMFIDSRAVDG
ncbi:unnamed protein product [Phytophthora fragariaefolia]|uniref:Unnamed protein product n=1 Tax=Phytophthora fragariaefolia TaxID=1490495 RepID=A0A9W6UC26_9STRA|nr:unnamed protein product [Phytophthora fragariaefolia]